VSAEQLAALNEELDQAEQVLSALEASVNVKTNPTGSQE
jgi:hypothetical protein